MIDYEEIEDALASHLGNSLDGIRVSTAPDDAARFRELGNRGAVIIRYERSEWSDAASAPGIAFNQEALTYNIAVSLRSLRSHKGVYQTLTLIRESLATFRFDGLSPFRPTGQGFVVEDNGTWWYEILIQARVVSVG